MALADESILTSIKKVLGIAEDYKAFDNDIIMHINSVFSELFQLGAGPQDHAFFIESDQEKWSEFFGVEPHNLMMVKSYVALSVRLMFDPPANSFGIESIKNQLQETKWRIAAAAEKPTTPQGAFNG